LFKHSLILAAVLTANSVLLLSASAADGWPAFKDISLETARAITVPAAIPASAVVSPIYAFDLPVENPSGLASPIKATDDKAKGFGLTVGRKGIMQIVFGGVEGDISDEQFCAHLLIVCLLYHYFRLFPVAGFQITTERSSLE